ncbi:MAG TPA: hypothetical protein VLU46_15040, partial [Thermoanaerobaculia bacterium]|nr:hypothetical protein [Thermoanaerobaculia bacterium]
MLRHQLAQVLARAEQQHADALRLQAERFGDLVVARFLHVREPQQRAFLRLQLGKEARHVVTQVERARSGTRFRDGLRDAITLRFAKV